MSHGNIVMYRGEGGKSGADLEQVTALNEFRYGLIHKQRYQSINIPQKYNLNYM
jgi:hypothetical protein